MKTIWILLAFIALTLADKLDRTYLPPPGSKFSGGSPGAIDVPLVFPKERFLSSSDINNIGNPDIAVGIYRIGPKTFNEQYGTTSLPNQKNEYGIPTTKSYASSESETEKLDDGSNNYIITPNLGEMQNNYESLYKPPSSTLQPGHLFNIQQEKKAFKNDDFLGNILEPHNNKYVTDKEIYDKSKNIYRGDSDNIPEINSYFVKQKTGPIVTSTSIYDSSSNSPENLFTTISSEYAAKPELSGNNIPYTYSSRPGRIQAQGDREAVILNYDNKITPDGYAYSFDTSNGINVEEEATALNGVQATGSYSYIGDDGKQYNVSYTADENGFRPFGDHLPSAPPIPDAIIKVIEQATKDREAGIYDDGSYDDSKYGYRNYEPNYKIRTPNKYRKGDPQFSTKQSNFPKLNIYQATDNEINSESLKTLSNKKEEIMKFNTNDLILELPIRGLLPGDKYGSKSNQNDLKMNEFQNTILNGIKKDTENIDNMLITELNDETGYEYSKPVDVFSLKTEEKLVNKISDTPDLNSGSNTDRETNDNIPSKPFMTPYVYQDDNTFLDYDSDNSIVDIPAQYQDQSKILPSVQNANTVLPTLAIPEINSTINLNRDNSISSISPLDDQGYFYPGKASNFNNNVYNPGVVSDPQNIPEVPSFIPREFPSRFNSIDNKEEIISINPSPYLDLNLFKNETEIPNRSSDAEVKEVFLKPTNIRNSYGEYIPGSTNKLNDTVFVINSGNNIKGEDFSGPKQKQKYDAEAGYYY